MPDADYQVGQRIPDGDTVLAPGQRRWADLIAAEQAAERATEWAAQRAAQRADAQAAERALARQQTQLLPVIRPLMTLGAWWRATRGGRR